MNKILKEEIVKHIFANFGIIPSDFVDQSKSKSLMNKEFLLSETLTFEDDSGVIHNKIWGCQISADVQEIKILLGDCSSNENIAEYAILIQLKNAPAYGIYLICDNTVEAEAMISCTANKADWMECSTYLQATFLAGMEQIREIGLSWHKCNDYASQHKLLLSFIKHHSKFFDENHSGAKYDAET